MALTLIERVLKRYPRNGGTYTDMTYTEIQNANFTLDLSRPPLTRIVNAGFPDRYIIGYTRIVNDFASTIDDIEPETMNMTVTNEVMVKDSDSLMLGRHNGYLYIRTGDNYYLALKPYAVLIEYLNEVEEKETYLLEKTANTKIHLKPEIGENFPITDHNWLVVEGARSIFTLGLTDTSTPTFHRVVGLTGEFLEIPEDKLPIFPEN